MTRKDYINIAAAILACQARIKAQFSQKRREVPEVPFEMQEIQEANQLRGVRRAAAHLADFLKEDNPDHFDPQLFLTNCGYGAPAHID